MKKKVLSVCLASMFLASSAAAFAGCGGPQVDVAGTAYGAPDVDMVINTNYDSTEARRQISDELFGVFLEDINYAGYVMDDNVVSNGSFEFGMTGGWYTDGGATIEESSGTISSDTNAKCASVGLSSKNSAIRNRGYDACPIAVTKDVKYKFEAFIKATEYTGNMTVSVKKADGTSVAEATITIQQNDAWAKYSLELTASESASKGLYFEMKFAETGTLFVDGVQLETTDSTVGVKNYIYEPIKELSPAFIRFPGGCVIEGNNMEDAYDWKNSIGINSQDKQVKLEYTEYTVDGEKTVTTYGEEVTRKKNRDIWGYNMDYSIGFYDYFLLCESVGASAIPIVNCGYSCQARGGAPLAGRYGNGRQDYINDALDLICFAKGDPESTDAREAKWAQIRVDMGHAEPFEMNYLGYGNEQWDVYFGYYESFLEALKEAGNTNPLYKTITPIVGNQTHFVHTEMYNANGGQTRKGVAQRAAEKYLNNRKISKISEYGCVDHHYYMSYMDFFKNYQHYDHYSRDEATRYDVFVGEYSANVLNEKAQTLGNTFRVEKNAWVNAIAEAAYMTGLEYNGDIVKLAAYAPMFGTINPANNQWQVDMMYFDNVQLVKSTNYYVQQLFAQNKGDIMVDSTLTYSEEFDDFTSYFDVNNAEVFVDRLYKVVSFDKETGDYVIKIVNAGDENALVNITLNGVNLTGVANVIKLANNDCFAVNTATETKVAPVTFTQGTGSKFGFRADAYSVNVIRVHTK